MKRLLNVFDRFNWWLMLIMLLGVVLRFFKLGQIPIGYTFDEVAIAYDAWSLSEWGVDLFLHPNPLVFESLGDFKAPLMIYLTSWIYTLVGFRLVTVRVISAVAGVVLVPLVYGLVKALLKDRRMALVAAGATALSPWSLHMSRVGFEVNLALVFLVAGVLLFLWGERNRLGYLLAPVFFGLTIITYHSPKIVAPLLLGWLWLLSRRDTTCLPAGRSLSLKKDIDEKSGMAGWVRWGWVLWSVVVMAFFYKTFVFGDALNRGQQTMIFYDSVGNLVIGWEQIKILFANVVGHLDPMFWVGGKQFTLRHIIPWFGILMMVELPVIVYGLWSLVKGKRRVFWLFSGWILIGMIPSIISLPSPHALRAAMMLPALMALVGYGWMEASRLRSKSIYLVGAFVLQYSLYLWNYYTVFPSASARDFSYGYFEAAKKADLLLEKGDKMILTTANGDPKYHALIALDHSPANYHAGVFEHVEVKEIEWPNQDSNVVYVATPEEIPVDDDAVVDVVKVPGTDEVVYVIARK